MTRRRGRAPAGTRLPPGRTTRAAAGGGGGTGQRDGGGGDEEGRSGPYHRPARGGGRERWARPLRPRGAAWVLPPSPEKGEGGGRGEWLNTLFLPRWRQEELPRRGGRMERATGRMGGGASPTAPAGAGWPLTLPCRHTGAAAATTLSPGGGGSVRSRPSPAAELGAGASGCPEAFPPPPPQTAPTPLTQCGGRPAAGVCGSAGPRVEGTV